MFLRNHDQTRTLTELNGDVARNKLAVSLLLTLPGLPFVYYGEELGMTGNKQNGDPRLRTPMHWSMEGAAGFTRGVPWEPLAPDSFTANVTVLERDSASLLNLHRKLIHLRANHPVLGTGEFVPLSSATGVLAYLRRSGSDAVLVVSNLTNREIQQSPLTAPANTLPSGRYTLRGLFGATGDTDLNVRGALQIRNTGALQRIGPYQTQIFQITRN
jgi:alpha-amylase